MKTKRCSCGNECINPSGPELPATLEYFYKHPTATDGFNSRCKDCTKAAAKQSALSNPESARERKRKYKKSEKGRAKGREHAKRQREKDPEKFRVKSRANYAKDIERSRANGRNAYWKNPQKRRENARKYKPNSVTLQVSSEVRRGRKANLPSKFGLNDWRFALDYFGHRCAVCGASPDMWTGLAMDHWIPLSDTRPENPGTVPWNIVPLCHSKKGAPASASHSCCNNSKSNKDPHDWLAQRFGVRKAIVIEKRIAEYFEVAIRWSNFLWAITGQWEVVCTFDRPETQQLSIFEYALEFAYESV